MIHWGINALNHGSSLAVFSDGDIKYFQASGTDEVPGEFIRQALHWGAPDELYWYERPWVKKARQLYAGQYKTAMDMSARVLPSRYLKQARLGYAPVNYTPHHASHAAAVLH